MRAFVVLAFAATLAGFGLQAGCVDQSIGRKCQNPSGDPTTIKGTQISNPALECRTRLCLLNEKDNTGAVLMPARTTCTARCNTNDDCAGALVDPVNGPANGQCKSKFVCAVAVQTGPFKCQTMCMCQDDVDPMQNGDTTATIGYGCPQNCMNNGGCVTANMLE